MKLLHIASLNACSWLLLLCMLALCGACREEPADDGTERGGSSSGTAQLKLVCTTGMIGDLATRVGGDAVSVETLMGPGVDPHLYQAKASDLRLLQAADVVFYNGLHLEAKLGEILERLESVRTVQVTSGMAEDKLLSPAEFEGQHDPHVWMDAELWASCADVVASTLTELDPPRAEVYRANAEAYRKELLELHEYIKSRLAELPAGQRVLVTAHDAFNYYGRAYGIEVRGLQGISTQAEAGTGDVQELVNFVVERRIPAIFVESSVPQRSVEAVQAAVRAKGWEVAIGGELFSDALGSPGTEEGTYIGMLRHNTDTIVGALAPKAAQ